MKVLRHRLQTDDGEAVSFRRSPNVGGALDPKYLVMHYTAGRSAADSIAWLTNSEARASAHLVIGRDGSITQLVAFDRVAWHAGASSWEGVVGLNGHSIGIELDNAGRLTRQGGRWRAWFGDTYPDDEVMEAVHKHESEPSGWHTYTPEQLDAALHVSRTIVSKYGLRDIIGHDDISPHRKSDPGPAFPMANFRARIFGRLEDELPLYETTVALNIRTGPGTHFDKLPASPLPTGTSLDVLGAEGTWRLVDVVDPTDGEPDIQGWVHGGYLRRVD
ncbi:MAG: N-acetylmuramoyl-L-alanine amidase [Gemmatimonadota bacterium]